jgi:hypothetical protein
MQWRFKLLVKADIQVKGSRIVRYCSREFGSEMDDVNHEHKMNLQHIPCASARYSRLSLASYKTGTSQKK